MARKRFSRYEYGLKKLMRTSNTTVAEPPAGSALEEYKKFKAGEKVITVTATPQDGKRGVTLKPFGKNPTAPDAPEYLYKMSNRAWTNRANVIDNPNKFGLTDPAGTEEKLPGFIPAMAIITILGEATTPKESAITGLTYKKKNNADSYTLPFGADSTNSSNYQIEAQAIIANGVAAKDETVTTSTISVAFKPERLYRS